MSFPVTVFVKMLPKQGNLYIARRDHSPKDGVCGEKSRSMTQSDLWCLALEIAKLAERWYMIKGLNSKNEIILCPDVSGLRG